MLFCSKQYLFFFAAVFALYWAIPWRRFRVLLLLLASFGFYASWNQWLALLIAVSTLIDYWLARGMDATSHQRLRRLYLAASVLGNLGLLAYFKYANFFLESLGQCLSAVGLSNQLPLLRVLVPVGISFYTFEAISYTVDVYRRKMPAERSLAAFMLFISFFPHLVAGPIVRARDLLPQVSRPKRWSWPRMQLGVQIFLLGLFKKLAIADRMALFADPVFADPAAYGSSAVWMATIAYALQIYCDFSGYSDMAIGSAHLLGYKLTRNFNLPYLACGLADFWHRWHISLSTWLRDYLYIPLGGGRGGAWRTCRNLLITMTLGGLWHGASWHFILWGVIHGLLLVGQRGLVTVTKDLKSLGSFFQTTTGTGLRWACTFGIICLTWILFRAETLADAGIMYSRLFLPHEGLPGPMHYRSLWYTIAAVAVAHAIGRWPGWQHFFERLPAPVIGFGHALLLTVALTLAPDSGKAFIYFQF